MAKDKKSVLLYCDLIHTVSPLTDEEAGRLFKHLLAYVNDLNPQPIDRLTGLLFEPIKQNLKRDLIKWEEKSQKNKDNARIRWNKNNANASERKEVNANDAVIVTDTVTVNDTVKDILLEKETKDKIIKSDFEIAFDSYLVMRKKIKKPATENAIELAKSKLNKLSGGDEQLAIEILNQSILNCWVDIWPLKTDAAKKEKATMRSTNEAFDEAKEFILNGGVINQ